MKNERFLELLDQLDDDLLEGAEDDSEQKAERPAKRRAKSPWPRWVAVAACLCLLIGAAVAIPMLRNPAQDDPGNLPPVGDSGDTSNIFDADAPEKLSGSPVEFLVGDSTAIDSPLQNTQPLYDFFFETWNFAVKARVVENLPDVYYMLLDGSSTEKPRGYRMIKMETLEIIHGEEVPQYFWYRIRDSLFVDMSVYDSLLISMPQIGAENYVMRNGTQNKMEAFSLPVFGEGYPCLGNVIAFTDGIFDEGLWQSDSWFFGYQYGKVCLDHPKTHPYVVTRGSSEEQAIEEIQKKIDAYKEAQKNIYKIPRTVTLSFTSEEAKAALAYVQPFENGVFAQQLIGITNSGIREYSKVDYRRYIDGCETEEFVEINLFTEEVEYSKTRYTREDLSSLEPIAAHLSAKAEEYAVELPLPPHTDAEGKELRTLYLFGWYVKRDDKVYGIVKTGWLYRKRAHIKNPNGAKYNGYLFYYDEAYTLYDGSAATGRTLSREELVELVGWRNISQKNLGEGFEIHELV